MQIPKRTKPLVQVLKDINIIRRYYKLSGNTYRVFPAYTKWRVKHRPIATFTRVNHELRFTLRALRIVNINCKHSYYILHTDQGIMTHHDALKLKIGGKLLAVVY